MNTYFALTCNATEFKYQSLDLTFVNKAPESVILKVPALTKIGIGIEWHVCIMTLKEYQNKPTASIMLTY